METLVALDIETTGLDPKEHAIIEIGAVKFDSNRVQAEWSTLIHPGQRIPPAITRLTGITDQMVLQAPHVEQILNELSDFVGDLPIVGHNIGFDLAFFRKLKTFKHNDLYDTYELAAVLIPNAGRYNLGALLQILGIPLPWIHRSLPDAQASRAVYLRLLERAQELPLPILAEILRLAENVDWYGYHPLNQVFKSRSREIVVPQMEGAGYFFPEFNGYLKHSAANLEPSGEIKNLEEEELAALLEPGGIFARQFSGYEFRQEQVAMLRSITGALNNAQHLMVEAGTGIGKSIAYLIPAALWSMQNKERLVISTNTINLQDQLINKDIPDLQNSLELDLHATVLKGRSNYLCPRRLESLRQRYPQNADELRVLAKILVWLLDTKTGDRSEINLNGPAERDVWMRFSADDEACSTENCQKKMSGNCPFFQARQSAHHAHIVIVNHALLLTDVATGNRILPEYNYLIVDEAHHLESATTNALSFQVSQNQVVHSIKELGSTGSGLLAWLMEAVQKILGPGDVASFNKLAERLTDQAFRLENLSGNFFKAVKSFVDEQNERREHGMYSHQERITPATRTQPAWSDIEVSWDEAQQTLQNLLETLTKIIQGIADINNSLPDEDNELFGSFSSIYKRLYELNEQVNALVFEPSAERVYWVEVQSNQTQLTLHTAPVHIGPLMERFIWNEKSAVILTSATLTTAGEFDYIRSRLNAENVEELQLGSPFDYETSSLLYIVEDIPEPPDRQRYQKFVEIGLINLCRATGGKTLALFTSYDQLRRTSRAISSALAKHDITVYEQGEGASPHTLLETFRRSERAVLLGTRAFWEGIDIPGEALSVLVIVKLPFDVPTEPIVAARAESFDDPFYQYSLPEAVLRFRQGFGRLIRSKSDRGVVAIFDRRLITKQYGRYFLDSLPRCTTKQGKLEKLPEEAARWLNL